MLWPPILLVTLCLHSKAWDSGAFGNVKFSEYVCLTYYCVFQFLKEITEFLTYIETY